jgi:3-deoxy-D-manno-octulosonate 8-phosphate phosphatase (KDO 8-P phosphatase)
VKLTKQNSEKLNNIKMLLLDNDGVLTDGSLHYNIRSIKMVKFNVKDGLGIKMAQSAGIKVGIVSGLSSRALKLRAKHLGIKDLHMRVKNKLKVYMDIKDKYSLRDEQIAFIGDDIIDLPIMLKCGFSVAVADAHSDVKKIVNYITELPGGKGAVREFIDLLLKSQGHWETLIKKYYEKT